ncbi:hypothetical protein GCM10008018_08510 [Paenibacillus marchantiophytorum]|uniref:Uncharacterized protein n=1 Tax=Paenibacillus marchantiophytorum TaxID=1619310 RepID=A0ABQ2BPV2_9BACL|nr:hypothetical protein GCM10008018_08510 [Paenibacillus marchantiophytorum]
MVSNRLALMLKNLVFNYFRLLTRANTVATDNNKIAKDHPIVGAKVVIPFPAILNNIDALARRQRNTTILFTIITSD